MWRLEPWSPDYALRDLSEGKGGQGARLGGTPLEEPWAPVPGQALDWPPFFLVDGRERVDALLSGGGSRVLLVSLAVGALYRDEGGMRLWEVRLERLAVGASEPLSFGEGLVYRPLLAKETDPMGLWQLAQKARRRLEAALAQELSQKALVLLDGPLYEVGRPFGPVLGYAKTPFAQYLPDSYLGLLAELKPRERTPVFQIPRSDLGRKLDLLSWYIRLPLAPEGLFPPESGLLRVETPLMPLEEARALADLSLDLFSSLASSPAKDPRAPQNLAPVGALETLLGRYLGQREVIQRRILSVFPLRESNRGMGGGA